MTGGRKLAPLLLLIPYVAGMLFLLTKMDLGPAQLLFILPAALGALLLLTSRFKSFLFLTVFVTPMSINLVNIGSGVGFSFPVEVMLILSAIGAVTLFIWHGMPAKNVMRHPVTQIILLQFLWIIITSTTSSYSLISAKFALSRLTYMLVFFFLFARIFQEEGQVRRFIWTYGLGFIPIMIYAIIHLGQIGYARRFSPEMAEPFFGDHTIFGAVVAMLLPMIIIWMFRRNIHLKGVKYNWLVWVMGGLAIFGLFISFSRAAWLSLILSAGLYLLLRVKVTFPMVVGIFCLLVSMVWIFQDPLLDKMRSNKNVSGEDFVEMAASVTSLQSDESNAERVNRWSCALRMGMDQPLTGFGPGTYESNYPPYQIKSEMTRISTMDGDRGDAHSEYLTAFSEQGFLGLGIWLLLVFALIRSGMRAFYTHTDPVLKSLSLGLLLGLFTYFIHGAVNSFLDIDKAAVLFWGMSAAIVVLDSKRNSNPNYP